MDYSWTTMLTNDVWIINYKHELGIFLFQSVKYVCYLLTATSCLQIKSDITGSLWGCFMVIEGALTWESSVSGF